MQAGIFNGMSLKDPSRYRLMGNVSISEITQRNIDKLLAQMQQLCQEITTARENIALLETNLAETHNEYQVVVGTFTVSAS
jgi:hypothetical protein